MCQTTQLLLPAKTGVENTLNHWRRGEYKDEWSWSKPKKVLTESEQAFLDMLIELLYFNSTSRKEDIIVPYIAQKLIDIGFEVAIDASNNIYAQRDPVKPTKDTLYPLLNAHMDIVSSVNLTKINNYQKPITIAPISKYRFKPPTVKPTCGECIFVEECAEDRVANSKLYGGRTTFSTALAYYKQHKPCTLFNSYIDHSTKKALLDDDYADDYTRQRELFSKQDEPVIPKKTQDELLDEYFKIEYNNYTQKITSNGLRILGGDDKCGIALAIQIAIENPTIPLKILFTTQEEVGCIGVSAFVKDNSAWLKNVKYSLTLDRRGNCDLLYKALGKVNCSKKFVGKLVYCALEADIIPSIENGSMSDVIILRDYIINCVNLSVGYHEPHTLTENIQFDAMLKIKQWITNIVTLV